jgi:hypothetical protein
MDGEMNKHELWLNERDDETGIFDQPDAFVNLSRGNETIQEVALVPYTDRGEDAAGTDRYAVWEKIAEGIGNLQMLSRISIKESHSPPAPDWEILACILRRLQRGIVLDVEWGELQYPEALPGLARVIRGQTMITGFSTGEGVPYQCLDTVCSTLLTLPALRNVSFNSIDEQDTEEGQSFESVIQLLRLPTLRQVEFLVFTFTNILSKAVAKALNERSEITDLTFGYCSFPEGGGTAIASALTTNTTLKRLKFEASIRVDEKVFYDVLAAVLLSNSTLEALAFSIPGGKCSWLSPLFFALQVNAGLKKLRISYSSSDLDNDNDTTLNGVREASRICIDERLSTAMRLGLNGNSTLELLDLTNINSSENDSSWWRMAFSSLHTNTALKALHMHFEPNMTESQVLAIRVGVLCDLRQNKSLETLSMTSELATFEDYLICVRAIHPNNTLKSLRLLPLHGADACVDQDETKDLITALKKNYGLEEIPGLQHGPGDISSILQLNAAGRRYLVQDGSSISKGVDVLSRVSNDTNSVFLHLLENPRLCGRNFG